MLIGIVKACPINEEEWEFACCWLKDVCLYVVLVCVQGLSVSGSLELKGSTIFSNLLVHDCSTTGPLYMLALMPVIT